jgi:hypothetical protein
MPRYKLRTLLIVLALGPPVLWGAYLVLTRLEDRLLIASFIMALLVCLRWAYLTLADNSQE